MPDMSKLVDLNGIAAVRDWANQKFSGGGSGLPEVTSEDNGDLLSVVDGAWAKSEPGYDVSEVAGTEIVPEQSVTAEVQNAQAQAEIGPIPWSPEVFPEAVVVVIDGTQYALEKTSESGGMIQYDGSGGITLTFLQMDAYFTVLMPASMAGTHTISVSEPGTREIVPSDDFKAAVNACGAPGYDVDTEEVEIAAAQSVTTAAQGPFIVGEITATVPDPIPDSINVTFNGTSYENVPKHTEASLGGTEIYGDSAFTEYPFVITFADGNLLMTQTAGTYTIEITGQVTTVTPDNNFRAAVKASGGLAPLVAHVQFDTVTASADKTYDQILAAYNAGQAVIFKCENFVGTVPTPPGISDISAYAIKQDNSTATFYASRTFVANNAVHTVSMAVDNGDFCICYYDHT